MAFESDDLGHQSGTDEVRASGSSSGVSRRNFLQIAGASAGAATAVLGSARVAMAGNGWTLGLEGVPDDKAIWMYRIMLRSRAWEEAIKESFLGGTDGLYGAIHLSVGEEACAAGIMAALNEVDVPCGPILSMKDIQDDKELYQRGMLVELDDPKRGRYVQVGMPTPVGDPQSRIGFRADVQTTCRYY